MEAAFLVLAMWAQQCKAYGVAENAGSFRTAVACDEARWATLLTAPTLTVSPTPWCGYYWTGTDLPKRTCPAPLGGVDWVAPEIQWLSPATFGSVLLNTSPNYFISDGIQWESAEMIDRTRTYTVGPVVVGRNARVTRMCRTLVQYGDGSERCLTGWVTLRPSRKRHAPPK